MKKLRLSKIVFVVSKLIGIGSFIATFFTYILVLFFISNCASKPPLNSTNITLKTPYHGKSRKTEFSPYRVSRGRNTGGPNKYYGYRVR
jgi:hypothetical protein